MVAPVNSARLAGSTVTPAAFTGSKCVRRTRSGFRSWPAAVGTVWFVPTPRSYAASL